MGYSLQTLSFLLPRKHAGSSCDSKGHLRSPYIIIHFIFLVNTCHFSLYGRHLPMEYTIPHARLAQLVERNIDVVDATGSSPVPRTNHTIVI